MVDQIELDLDAVGSWCRRNRLKLSETKSKVVLLGSNAKLKTVDHSKSLYLNRTCLDFVDKYKYLGITLDKYMNLSHVISEVKKKVTYHLFKLRKLRTMITEFCAICINRLYYLYYIMVIFLFSP